jgi:heme-degrading monooxygenase HmoA
MIARHWIGRTDARHREAYLDYLKETGVVGCRSTEGNRGVEILVRLEGNEAEFMFVSFWESLEAIRKFAGDDVERAVYYPRDREYLLALDPHVRHYEVAVRHDPEA